MDAKCLGWPPTQTALLGRITRLPAPYCNYCTKFYPVQDIADTYQVQTHNSCVCNELRALRQRHLIDAFSKAKFSKPRPTGEFVETECRTHWKPFKNPPAFCPVAAEYRLTENGVRAFPGGPCPRNDSCRYCGVEIVDSVVEKEIWSDAAKFNQAAFDRHAREFVNMMPTGLDVLTYAQVIDAYDGAKKRRYKTAREELRGVDKTRAWAAVQMFVKPDRYDASNVYDKAPRAIQFRHPCFNLRIARFLKSFEHAYYQHVDWTGYKVVAKGQNNVERATNIVETSAMFRNPVYVLMDHKKFDAHVTVPHLLMLHRIYNRCFRDRRLSRLLQYQIKNRGFSKGGIRYKVTGTRMSGDYDTGLGNTLLNHYLIYTVLYGCKYHLLLDGDDSVVVMEADDVHKLDADKFLELGMETDIQVVRELSEVEFCRAKLLVLDPPRFARDPIRALSNMTVSFKSYPSSGALQYVAGLGTGEAAASNGVPIIGPIAWKMSQAHAKPIVDENIKYMYGAAGDPLDITDEARAMLYDQYGISPEMQKAMEQSYETPRRVCYQLMNQCYNARPYCRGEIPL